MTAITDRISDKWDDLTKSDRLVARRLQADYPIAGLKTLAELATRAGVSAPSVIRCIRKLGFDSYPEFQSALHAEVQSRFDGAPACERALDANAGDRSLESTYVSSVQETIRLMQRSDVERLAALIARSRTSVLCLGGRISQALAMIMQAHLLRLRPNVELASNNPVQRAERLMDVAKGDVVVVFDYAPYDSHSVSFARLAQQNKAIVVCFTDVAQSPAAQYSQFVFNAEMPNVEGVSSLSGAVCSMDIILRAVREKIGIRATSRQESLAILPLQTLHPAK